MNFNYLSNHFEGEYSYLQRSAIAFIYGRAIGDRELREYEEMKAHDVAFKHICKLASSERTIQFADVGNRKHLENLFKEKIIEMLKRGIHSKNHKMDLNVNQKLSTRGDNT